MNNGNALQKQSPEPLETPRDGSQLAPQPHGGAIRVGNPKGHVAGPGAPPSIVRERCRSSFLALVPKLEKIANGENYTCEQCGYKAGNKQAEDRDVIRAIDTLGRYGLMTGRLDLEEVRARLHRTIAKIEELCDPDTAARILSAIDPIWNPKKG